MNSKFTRGLRAIGVAFTALACVGTNASDAFDPVTKRLTLESVTVVGKNYNAVAVTVNSYTLLTVGSGAPTADTFDPNTNILTLGAVAFQGAIYNNVQARINSYTLLGVGGGLGPLNLTDLQLSTCDDLTAVFETGKLPRVRGSVENLADSAGFTIDWAALTTAYQSVSNPNESDVGAVARQWTTLHPTSPLAPSLPVLNSLVTIQSDDTTALEAKGFSAAWKTEVKDPAFQALYDNVFHANIAFPAHAIMAKHGARSALAACIGQNLYNLHGFADDYDSGNQILSRATAAAGGTPASGAVSETAWLRAVADKMYADEMNAQTTRPGLAQAMRNGAPRCLVLRALVDAGNLDLTQRPIDTGPYGVTIQ